MTPERWRQIEQVYHAALDRDPRSRAAYVEENCAGDESLKREVNSLLARDASEFSAATMALFNDPGRAAAMAKQARMTAEQKWDWSSAMANLEASYRSALECARPASCRRGPPPDSPAPSGGSGLDSRGWESGVAR